jgi:hypothetical protein
MGLWIRITKGKKMATTKNVGILDVFLVVGGFYRSLEIVHGALRRNRCSIFHMIEHRNSSD